jgi:hypothetical protein
MKLTKVHLFVVLLLALVFCSFLGGTCTSGGAGLEGFERRTAKAVVPIDRKNQGIPSSQILPGQEDLYILKSQVVPPVCPACPVKCPASSSGNGKCPPCPPCARCPEPAFECKKVPNYRSDNDNVIPRPLLTDFSQFGM